MYTHTFKVTVQGLVFWQQYKGPLTWHYDLRFRVSVGILQKKKVRDGTTKDTVTEPPRSNRGEQSRCSPIWTTFALFLCAFCARQKSEVDHTFSVLHRKPIHHGICWVPFFLRFPNRHSETKTITVCDPTLSYANTSFVNNVQCYEIPLYVLCHFRF